MSADGQVQTQGQTEDQGDGMDGSVFHERPHSMGPLDGQFIGMTGWPKDRADRRMTRS